ncbi:MAG: hypothetical protein KF886_01820 [Candidatus Hydrogenedentes bacterium]|nr:hypothetical protein [Candidatus Hydrogenedentota bacterium]
MKNLRFGGLIALAMGIAQAASAGFVGTMDGSASGVDSFGPGQATLDNTPPWEGGTIEFSALLTGEFQDNSPADEIDLTFNFFESGGLTFLELFTERTSGDIYTFSGVTVEFSNWTYNPSGYVLNGLALADGDLQGLNFGFTDDTLTIEFDDFYVDESRSVGIELIFAEETGPGTPVVPLPGTLTLGLLGFGGVVVARRFRRA